jgi:hypothetical protein
MDKRKDTDILGQTVEVGDVICFCSSGAQLDVGVVTSLKHRRNGDLIGYNIIYPLYPYMFSRREDKTILSCPQASLARLQAGKQGAQTASLVDYNT